MRAHTLPGKAVVGLLGPTVGIVIVALTSALNVSSQPPETAGIVNVKDFRAVGDGITDDTPAIKKALAAALRSKGTVYLPPGTYLINDTLEITDTVAIVGAGWGSTLMLEGGIRKVMILVQGTSAAGKTVGFQASNFVLDGNHAGQLDAGLLQLNSAIGFVVDHLWVRNGGRRGESRSQGVGGIAVAAKSLTNLVGGRGVLMNSLIEGTTKPGILWSTHATDGLISGNIIRGVTGNSQAPCLAVSEGRDVTVVGNSVSGCEGAGISIANGGNNVAPLHAIIANNHAYENGTGSVEGSGIQVVNAAPDRAVFVEITGNVLYGNRGFADGYGVFVQNVDHVVVKGNIVRNNHRSGIVLYNVANGIVEGNYVFGNNTLGTPEHSGIMLHRASRIHVTGNFVFDDGPTPTQAYGLFFSGTRPSDRIWVSNNVLYPNKRGAWQWQALPLNTFFVANRSADASQLAIGSPTPGGQLEITATTSATTDSARGATVGPVHPALYLNVKYGGRAYKIPLYNP